jgi:hypothetical protein
MKRIALLSIVLLCAAASVQAASADLAVVSATSSKPTVATGERFTLTLRAINRGPDASPDVTAGFILFYQGEALYLLGTTAPAGWTCNSGLCQNASFAAGAEAEIQVNVLAPAHITEGVPLDIIAEILPKPIAIDSRLAATAESVPDPDRSNNERRVAIALVPAAGHADLQIAATPSANPVPKGAAATVTLHVANGGPDDAHDVIVLVTSGFGIGGVDVPLTPSADGWTCVPESERREAWTCRRPLLAAGAAAPIRFQFTAPQHEAKDYFYSRILAENNFDPGRANDELNFSVSVGSADEWSRILIPVTSTNIPGFGGSLWKTDISVLADAQRLEYLPARCVYVSDSPCFLASRQPLDFRQTAFVWPNRSAQFVYMRASDESKFHLNARVYDVSRQTETAGTEMPLPREREFTADRIMLLNIPVRPEYRHTLRVYDLDGRDGARITVSLYANGEEQPRAVATETLRLQSLQERLTTALLPAFPAQAQLDLGSLLPLQGLDSLRLEVKPADQGVRIWGFVSITNNDTHHVTVVSPQ